MLQLDGFASKAVAEQSAQLGVSVEEFATFAVLYYLADLDSGRVARQIPPLSAAPDASESLREQHRG